MMERLRQDMPMPWSSKDSGRDPDHYQTHPCCPVERHPVMTEQTKALVRVEADIGDVVPEDWDRCANPATRPYNPFLSHAFLHALEQSGSVRPESGWLPQHLVLEVEDSQVAAVMPCYLKGHSQGEYVFDHGWADAFERAGGQYYPKLQVAVPFTPATGRRLLVSPDRDDETTEAMLLNASIQLCERLDASSVHLTFLTKPEWDRLGTFGLLQRTDQQFHWQNQGYETFDDFLAALTSRKRKTVRRERTGAMASGVKIEWLTGKNITEAHWDAFFQFYIDTGDRKWGRPYLTREFFSLVSQSMADRILLIMCRRDDRYIAGALNFIGGDTLYGRHWGCIEDHRFLHFEACYYQAIDYAIAHKLSTVEAGAQGPHKLARGYVPVTTYSAHYIADAGLRDAVARYLERERYYVDQEGKALAEHAPFRKNSDDDEV